MINLLLIDNEIIFNDSLQFLLLQERDDLSITAMQSVDDLLLGNRVKEFDYVFISLDIKHFDVEKTIKHFLHLQSKIILFIDSMNTHKDLLLKVLTYPLEGVLLKTMQSEAMLKTINHIFTGQRHLPQSVTLLIWNHYISLNQPSEKKRPINLLSEREWEILEFLCLGMSNKAISKTVYLSENTIKNYIASLFKKIGVKDRTSAAITAYNRGWL